MANYILAGRHYSNEAEVIKAIVEDCKKNGFRLNMNDLRDFLHEDAIILNRPENLGRTGSYSLGNGWCYSITQQDYKVTMIWRGKRQVLGAMYGMKNAVSFSDATIVATF